MIYKQLEESDKVTGRTGKISSGTFSGDKFQLIDMYIDDSENGEIDTPLSYYIGNTDTNGDGNLDIVKPNYISNQTSPALNTNYESSIDMSETISFHNENWTEVRAGDYYVNVYDLPVSEESSEVQFTIAYGDKNGYGSRVGEKTASVTKAIYNQYKNILLGPGDDYFTFIKSGGEVADRESIYIMNFASDKIKEKLDEGNLEFTLKIKHQYTDPSTLEPKEIVYEQTFRDDSRFQTEIQLEAGRSRIGKVFNIIKGSLVDTAPEQEEYYSDGGGLDGDGEGFGLFYPDLGIVILNPFAIASDAGNYIRSELNIIPEFSTNDNDQNAGTFFAWCGDIENVEGADSNFRYGTERNHQNFMKLFYALKDGGNIKCRSTENIPSKHYFIRVKNTDFNYSNNPTYVYQMNEAKNKQIESGVTKDYWYGRIRHEDFIEDPKTYITTVGLYTEDNELVAVGKLSVPVLKSFDSETLIKVKLDF
jgi:hypothetical protein